jgi:hypothetical protein
MWRLAQSPYFNEFWLTIFFPASLVAPVESFEFAWLAAIWAGVDIFVFLFVSKIKGLLDAQFARATLFQL